MKAEDIVKEEMARQAKFGYEPSWVDFAIAGQKAGIQETLAISGAVSHLEVYRDGKKAGIKEVVEWLKSISDNNNGYGHIAIYPSEWQAKLKEWGVE